MTTSVRELLETGAAEPDRPCDLDAITRVAAGRRRRNHRGFIATIVVVVACVVTVVVVVERRDGASPGVVAPPASAALAPRNVPDGWSPVTNPATGISLAVPPGWGVEPSDVAESPRNILVVGSADRGADGAAIAACAPAGVPPTSGTWVSLYEYRPDGPFPHLEGEFSKASFTDRPTTFDGGFRSRCGPRVGAPSSQETVAFVDGGRYFVARIIAVQDPDDAGLRLGRQVLDTLRVAPAGEAPSPDTDGLRREPYRFFTHCGIEWAFIDDAWWQADAPFSDFSVSPPPGWGRPFQEGVLVFLDDSTVEFQSSAGNVTFRQVDPPVPTPVCF